MTFLSPLFWAGLLLAGLPLLIHLLGRRRRPRQPFPALELLRRLRATRVRRWRVRRWLLLALRTLGLLLLALAFMRPALHRAAGGGGESDTVVLLDLSASMGADTGEGTSLDRARTALKAVWRAGGEFALVVASEDSARDLPWRSAQGDAPGWIEQLSVDGRAEAGRAGWERALARLAGRTAVNREIVWISDFTSPPPDTLTSAPSGVTVRRIMVGPHTAANAAPVRVALLDPLPRPGDVARIEARFSLHGAAEPWSAMARVMLDGRRVAEAEVDLRPGGSTVHTFPVRVPEVGEHAGEIVLEREDALLLDNRRAFVLEVPRSPKVLLAGEDIRALRYLELALTGGEAAAEVTVRPGPPPESLAGWDVLLVAGLRDPDAVLARRLADFVSEGGGLWLMLSDRTDPAALGRTVLPELGLGDLAAGGRQGRARWQQLDRTHPALSDLLVERGEFDAPVVMRALTAHVPAEARTLVRMGDGRPFLVERTLERGRVWWTPSAAHPEWSDWPLSGIFAPMVRQGMAYLAHGSGGLRQPVACGEPILWPLPAQDAAPGVREVTDPLGSLLPAVPAFRGGTRVLATRETIWPGIYRLAGDGYAAAAVPEGESVLRGTSSAAGWPGQVLEARGAEALTEALVRQRRGTDLAPWLLLAALILLMSETLVARESRPDMRTGEVRQEEHT